MAAWQFDLQAVGPNGSTVLPPQLRVRAESFLHGLMPRSIESRQWTQYGADGGNRIDVLGDDQSCEIELRIDARAESDAFLDLICLLTTSLNCTLYVPEFQQPVQPDVASLKKALMLSDAWRYALGLGSPGT